MDLPQITIPKAIVESIPMEQIPAIVHPPLVHFAIVLPIMIVLLEIVNIIVKMGATPEEPKGRGVSALSFLLVLAMVVIFSVAYLSGSVDGKAAWDSLSQAGQSELKEHKLIGTYLVYGSVALLLFKLFSFVGAKARVLFLLLAIAFAAGTLKQGKDGGELVYKYGANVEAMKLCDEERFDLKDDLESCEEDAKKAPAKAPSDSVAKEESAAIADPAVKGEAAAKAKVEETQSKDAFEAKETSTDFKKESAADEKKTVAADEEKKAASTMHDSVAPEASAAIADPAVKGEAAAKAEIEETQSKDAEAAKEAAPAFDKEAASDEQKTISGSDSH
jgi:uncharacterized membrane protein